MKAHVHGVGAHLAQLWPERMSEHPGWTSLAIRDEQLEVQVAGRWPGSAEEADQDAYHAGGQKMERWVKLARSSWMDEAEEERSRSDTHGRRHREQCHARDRMQGKCSMDSGNDPSVSWHWDENAASGGSVETTLGHYKM